MNRMLMQEVFQGQKVKYMKNYVKPRIREKNPDYAILYVRTHELNSDLPPERIAKPITDIAKNTQSKNLIVSVSGALTGNGNFNIKSIEVNKELSIMFDKKKLLFLNHSNINRKNHLHKSKPHLNRNGYENKKNVMVIKKNFIKNVYA